MLTSQRSTRAVNIMSALPNTGLNHKQSLHNSISVDLLSLPPNVGFCLIRLACNSSHVEHNSCLSQWPKHFAQG